MKRTGREGARGPRLGAGQQTDEKKKKIQPPGAAPGGRDENARARRKEPQKRRRGRQGRNEEPWGTLLSKNYYQQTTRKERGIIRTGERTGTNEGERLKKERLRNAVSSPISPSRVPSGAFSSLSPGL